MPKSGPSSNASLKSPNAKADKKEPPLDVIGGSDLEKTQLIPEDVIEMVTKKAS